MTNLSGTNLNNSGAVGPKGESRDSQSNFPAYPEYKDSGIEWLGEVPTHWTVHSLKRSVEGCVNGIWGDEPDGKNEIAVIRVADFERSALRVGIKKMTYRSVTQKEKESRGLRSGDLLIEKSGGGDKTLVGCVVLFDHPFEAVCSNFVARIRPRKGFDSGFLSYAFDCLYQGKVNYPSIKQTTGIQNLDSEAYLQESFCFPLLEEQTQIARFLDHETARIDALIEEQQRLIELLKEKRQAVISHAVTKGLDPNVPMKDSGVEWLGEVPEHWEIRRFGYIATVVRGGSPRPAGDPELFNGDYSPWVTVAEITKDEKIYLDETETFLTKKGSEQCRVFRKGTLVLSNSGATLGVPKILNISANANDGVVGFENLLIDTEFTYFYLSTLTQNLRERIRQGSGQPNLNTDIVRALVVPIPSDKEMRKIVDAIKDKRRRINLLIDSADRGIDLLQERRSALISAAVTGKIDVRNWQSDQSSATDTDDYAMVAEPAAEYR